MYEMAAYRPAFKAFVIPLTPHTPFSYTYYGLKDFGRIIMSETKPYLCSNITVWYFAIFMFYCAEKLSKAQVIVDFFFHLLVICKYNLKSMDS